MRLYVDENGASGIIGDVTSSDGNYFYLNKTFYFIPDRLANVSTGDVDLSKNYEDPTAVLSASGFPHLNDALAENGDFTCDGNIRISKTVEQVDELKIQAYVVTAEYRTGSTFNVLWSERNAHTDKTQQDSDDKQVKADTKPWELPADVTQNWTSITCPFQNAYGYGTNLSAGLGPSGITNTTLTAVNPVTNTAGCFYNAQTTRWIKNVNFRYNLKHSDVSNLLSHFVDGPTLNDAATTIYGDSVGKYCALAKTPSVTNKIYRYSYKTSGGVQQDFYKYAEINLTVSIDPIGWVRSFPNAGTLAKFNYPGSLQDPEPIYKIWEFSKSQAVSGNVTNYNPQYTYGADCIARKIAAEKDPKKDKQVVYEKISTPVPLDVSGYLACPSSQIPAPSAWFWNYFLEYATTDFSKLALPKR